MKGRFLAVAIAILAAPLTGARAEPLARAPVVVELYTSQGCAQCPRANRRVGEFARDDGVIALTFAVGYWDYLGWTDTFARPEFTDRQRAFSRALHTRAPFTPQLIYNGVRQLSADDWDGTRSALQEVQAMPTPEGAPRVTIRKLDHRLVRVSISAGVAGSAPADVWLVSFDPGPMAVRVGSGENSNMVMAYYNLVDTISRAGAWSGAPLWFERAHCTPECAVLVQQPNGGRIIAAAMTPGGLHRRQTN